MSCGCSRLCRRTPDFTHPSPAGKLRPTPWYNRFYRRLSRLRMKSFRLGIAFWIAFAVAVSAQSSVPAQAAPPPSLPPSGGFPAYVNSGGLRLRDFPSVADGQVLRLLPEGIQVNVQAVTQWKERIGGQDYAWYEITPIDDPSRSGWVFGRYLTFETGNPFEQAQLQRVSRQHMNRVLLVLEIFRTLLHTNTFSVPASWTSGRRLLSATVPGGSILAASPLRIYEAPFGTVEVSVASQTGEYPVFAITVNKPTAGLLLSVGDQEVRLAGLFGSDFYSVGSARQYRYSQIIDTYAVSVEINHGKVSSIQIGALME